MRAHHHHQRTPGRYRWLIASWTLALAAIAPLVPARPTPEVETELEPTTHAATHNTVSIRAPNAAAESPTLRTDTARRETESTSPNTVETNDCNAEDVSVTNEIRGLVVIVHASNPTKQMSRKNIAKLFLKRIKKWDEWDRAVKPVDQKDDAETRSLFSREVHSMRVSSVEEYWLRMIFSGRGSPPSKLNGDKAVIAFVANNPGAIGYVSAHATLNTRVKTLLVTD